MIVISSSCLGHCLQIHVHHQRLLDVFWRVSTDGTSCRQEPIKTFREKNILSPSIHISGVWLRQKPEVYLEAK